MAIVSINVDDLLYTKIGVMSIIYPNSYLVQDLASLLASKDIKIPSNKVIKYVKTENRIKIDTDVYLTLHYRLMGEVERFRMKAIFAKTNMSTKDVLNKMYYFVGICNMMSYLRPIRHSFDWTEKTLLFDPNSRCFIFESNFRALKKCLAESCILYEDKKFKDAINKFIEGVNNISAHLGQWFSAIDFTKFDTEEMLSSFGFRKVLLDNNDRCIYLLPGYLISSLGNADNLEGAVDFERSDFYYYADYDRISIKDVKTGYDLKRSYIPFYKDGTHILYGFEILSYKDDDSEFYGDDPGKKKKHHWKSSHFKKRPKLGEEYL